MRRLLIKVLQIIKLLLVLVAVTACTSAKNGQIPVNLMKLSAPQTVTGEYVINAGDTLEIKFFYNPELNELVTVRPDGRISLQLANEIMVSGLTPAELTELLRKKYSEDIEKPEITVMVRTFTPPPDPLPSSLWFRKGPPCNQLKLKKSNAHLTTRRYS